MNIKLILIFLILSKESLLSEDVAFEFFNDAESIYANTKRFFYLVINSQDINSSKYCEILEDFNLKNLGLKDNFYLSKIFEVLQCDFDLSEIDKDAE